MEVPYRLSPRCSAVRGGYLLCLLSIAWVIPAFWPNPLAILAWPAGFWLAFPVGAVVGGKGLNRLREANPFGFVGTALLIGTATGLVLATGYWLEMSMPDLIGLVRNAHSGGYASYRLSILRGFRENAVRLGSTVLPLGSGIIVVWELFRHFRQRDSEVPVLSANVESIVILRLGWPHVLVCLINAGFMAALILAMAIFGGRAGNEVKDVGWMLVGSMVTPMIGPWIGPFIGSGWDTHYAWRLSWAALPLALAIFPFALRLKMRHRTGTLCWVAYITAWMIWWVAGMYSAATRMG